MKYYVCILVAVVTLTTRAAETPPPYPPNAALQYWIAFANLNDISAEDKKSLGQAFNAPPGENRSSLATRLNPVVTSLHRAAKIPGADWGLDIGVDGPHTRIPHVSKARELARAALFVARERFDRGRAAEGLDLLFDVLTLGRHLGRDGSLMARLVESAITNMALDALNQEVMRIPREELQKLDARFAALPPANPISECIKSERRMLEWYGSLFDNPDKTAAVQSVVKNLLDIEDKVELLRIFATPEVFQAELRKLQPVYAAIETALSVPYTEYEPAMRNATALSANAGVLAKLVLPVFSSIRTALDRTELQFAITRTGIQIALNGEPAALQSRDPFGTGPFAYAKLPNGFQLTSSLTADNKPIRTLFGEAARKAPPPIPNPINPQDAIRPPAPPNPGEF